MRRSSVLMIVFWMVAAIGLPAVAQVRISAVVAPTFGPPGTAATVTASDFSPFYLIEVHAVDASGPLLGSALPDKSGDAMIPITIPGDAREGTFPLFVCSTGRGFNCGDEFSQALTVIFQVTLPRVTTTTTTTTTLPPPPVTPAGACAIPEGAIHLDFDAYDASSGVVSTDRVDVASDFFDAGFLTHQNSFETISAAGVHSASGPVQPGSSEGDSDISAFAARVPATNSWLGSSSSPNVLRAVGPGHFSVEAYRVLPGEMDYFGFNIGLGWYSEGFQRPDYVIYDVTITMLPVHEGGGSTTAAWDPVSVTLGPGPQAVNTCVYLENTAGVGHPMGSTWLIDIVPRHQDGSPIVRISQQGGILLEVDDVFYGTNGGGATPAGACSIPAGAIHLDFDSIDTSAGRVVASAPALATYFADRGFVPFQYSHETISAGGTHTASGPTTPGSGEGEVDVTGTVAHTYAGGGGWLGSSSPPNAMRAVGPGRFSVEAYRVLPGGMTYFGFNLGLGWYGEGFENPAYVVYDVTVRMLPVHESDGSVSEASWPSVSVTLGPGPQPVTTCVYLENTGGVGHTMGSTWLIDVVPRHVDGTPIVRISQQGGILLEMDDVFYGGPPLVFEVPNNPIVDSTLAQVPLPGAIPSDDEPPWVPILVILLGLSVVGVIVTLLLGRRTPPPPPPSAR